MKWSVGTKNLQPFIFEEGVWKAVVISDSGEESTPEAPKIPYAFPASSPWNVPNVAETPTPDGTGSVVHPGVVDMERYPEKKIGGFRYWMGITPYSKSYDQLENPCVMASNDGWYWVVPAGVTNPLDHPVSSPYPGGYNSDTDMVWDSDNKNLVIYWRRVQGNKEILHAATAGDGSSWDIHYNIVVTGGPAPTSPAVSVLSPSLCQTGSHEWRMFTALGDSTLGGSQIQSYTSTSALGPWVFESGQDGTALGITSLWHLHVMRHDDIFYCVAVTRNWRLYPGVSVDGKTWTFGQPFLNEGLTYRAAIQPYGDNQFSLWYSYEGMSEKSKDWWMKYTRVPVSIWDNLPLPSNTGGGI